MDFLGRKSLPFDRQIFLSRWRTFLVVEEAMDEELTVILISHGEGATEAGQEGKNLLRYPVFACYVDLYGIGVRWRAGVSILVIFSTP